MYKFQPYQQYEVLAIESWLNEIAGQGYKLTSFGAYFCKFEKWEGPRIYYRVRYIPANKDIKGALFWGDLYVYQSENPQELPVENYDEDARNCAAKYGKPHVMMSDLVVISAIIKSFFPLPTGDTLLFCAVIAAILLWTIHLISNGMVWYRAIQISSDVKKVTLSPPKKYLKIVSMIEIVPAVIIVVLAIAAQFY